MANTKIHQKRNPGTFSITMLTSRFLEGTSILPGSRQTGLPLDLQGTELSLRRFICPKVLSLWSSGSVRVLKPLGWSQTPSSDTMTMVSHLLSPFQDIPSPCILFPPGVVSFCLILFFSCPFLRSWWPMELHFQPSFLFCILLGHFILFSESAIIYRVCRLLGKYLPRPPLSWAPPSYSQLSVTRPFSLGVLCLCPKWSKTKPITIPSPTCYCPCVHSFIAKHQYWTPEVILSFFSPCIPALATSCQFPLGAFHISLSLCHHSSGPALQHLLPGPHCMKAGASWLVFLSLPSISSPHSRRSLFLKCKSGFKSFLKLSAEPYCLQHAVQLH